jgi:hypothetical protein
MFLKFVLIFFRAVDWLALSFQVVDDFKFYFYFPELKN